MAELLSYAETKKLLDDLPAEQKKLVEELIPSQISVTGVQQGTADAAVRARFDSRSYPRFSKALRRPWGTPKTPC